MQIAEIRRVWVVDKHETGRRCRVSVTNARVRMYPVPPAETTALVHRGSRDEGTGRGFAEMIVGTTELTRGAESCRTAAAKSARGGRRAGLFEQLEKTS